MHRTDQIQGHVDPAIALALLEALRSTDRPRETLDDEDVQRSLPRRLGLSGVVERQIHRYSDMRDRGRRLDARELGDLFRLIGRRTDAGEVCGEAGRRLARQELGSRGLGVRMTTPMLPGVARRRMLRRSVQDMVRALCPTGTVRVERGPFTVLLEGSLPAAASGSPAGCELLSQGFRIYAQAYLRRDVFVRHPLCEGSGEARCVWRLESAPPG